jgi:predicted amidohydrolase
MNNEAMTFVSEEGLPEAPASGHVRIAGIQLNPLIGEAEINVSRTIFSAAAAAKRGASLIVYPECSLTGYCFDSAEEVREAAIQRDGKELKLLGEMAGDLKATLVVGYLERIESVIGNTASILTPDGGAVHYRKTHLPHLGADRFVEPGGEPFRLFEAAGLKTGVLICYDASFPEASRLLTLAGADLILLPTNWPEEAEGKAVFLPNARAYENVIYFASINRVGTERGFTFHGVSRICDPEGKTVVEGPRDEEAILLADIDPERARNKRIERRPGYWLDRIAQRREDLYRLEAVSERGD